MSDYYTVALTKGNFDRDDVDDIDLGGIDKLTFINGRSAAIIPKINLNYFDIIALNIFEEITFDEFFIYIIKYDIDNQFYDLFRKPITSPIKYLDKKNKLITTSYFGCGDDDDVSVNNMIDNCKSYLIQYKGNEYVFAHYCVVKEHKKGAFKKVIASLNFFTSLMNCKLEYTKIINFDNVYKKTFDHFDINFTDIVSDNNFILNLFILYYELNLPFEMTVIIFNYI